VLTAIEIENFKAFGERQRIELRPITLLFGPNSGGKSSVAHALHYLREVICEGNLDAHRTWSGGDMLDLGGIRNFVHARQPGTTIRLKAEFSIEVQDLPLYLEGEVAVLEPDQVASNTRLRELLQSRISSAAVELEIESDNGGHIQAWRTWINGEPVGVVRFDRMRPHAELREINWSHPVLLEDTIDKRSAEGAKIRAILRNRAPALEEVDAPTPVENITDEPVTGALVDLCVAVGIGTMADSVIHVRLPRGVLYDTERPLPVAVPNASDRDGADHEESKELLADLLSQLFLGPLHVLKKSLSDLRYVGPLRAMPPRQAEPPDRHGRSHWPTGLQAWERLACDIRRNSSAAEVTGDLITEASRWLESEDRLDTGYRLERDVYQRVPVAISSMITNSEYVDRSEMLADAIRALPERTQIVLRDVGRNITLQPQDVGVGLSQIVPVIVALLDPGGQLVALEQPELHLHPRQQAALGDALIKGLQTVPDRVLVVETHSEHLILRVLRRIRETTRKQALTGQSLTPDQLRIHYIRREGSVSRAQTIDVDVNGDLVDPWPDDFFEQDFKERFS